jgi:hypothetical protein
MSERRQRNGHRGVPGLAAHLCRRGRDALLRHRQSDQRAHEQGRRAQQQVDQDGGCAATGQHALQSRAAEQGRGDHADLSHAAVADRRRQSGRCRSARARGSAAEQLQLGRSVEGDGQDSHRAGHAVDCAARVARGAGGETQQPMTGDSVRRRHHAADQRICAHQLRAGTGGAGCRQAAAGRAK